MAGETPLAPTLTNAFQPVGGSFCFQTSLPAPSRWGKKAARNRPHAERLMAEVPATAGNHKTAPKPAATEAAQTGAHGIASASAAPPPTPTGAAHSQFPFRPAPTSSRDKKTTPRMFATITTFRRDLVDRKSCVRSPTQGATTAPPRQGPFFAAHRGECRATPTCQWPC